MELQLEELEAAATEDEIAAEIAAAKTHGRQAASPASGLRASRFRPSAARARGDCRAGDLPVLRRLALSKLGEDVTETLEVIPRQWKVIQHVREKFSCRDCEASARRRRRSMLSPAAGPVPASWPCSLFEKFGQHQPLNRQAERYAREGVPLSLSTLADQVGALLGVLRPIFDRFGKPCARRQRLHGDDTTVPVLAKGKTDIARSLGLSMDGPSVQGLFWRSGEIVAFSYLFGLYPTLLLTLMRVRGNSTLQSRWRA